MEVATDHSASEPGCWLNSYHQPACLETDVGPLHHYRWRGGVNNKKGVNVKNNYLNKLIVLLFISESETITDIVYDVTGFDMNEITKADLHKEMSEKALSAISFTPDISDVEVSGLLFILGNI